MVLTPSRGIFVAVETCYHGGSWMALKIRRFKMVLGKLLITMHLDEDPPYVNVDSSSPNLAGFYSRRRASDLTYDGEIQDSFEAEVALAFPENEPV
jgi:hypothetical protein